MRALNRNCLCRNDFNPPRTQKGSNSGQLLVSVPARESQTPCKRCKRMAGATELECGASVTRQRSNQLNYVPNRGINNLPQNLAIKGFARFAYSALFARSRNNIPTFC